MPESCFFRFLIFSHFRIIFDWKFEYKTKFWFQFLLKNSNTLNLGFFFILTFEHHDILTRLMDFLRLTKTFWQMRRGDLWREKLKIENWNCTNCHRGGKRLNITKKGLFFPFTCLKCVKYECILLFNQIIITVWNIL